MLGIEDTAKVVTKLQSTVDDSIREQARERSQAQEQMLAMQRLVQEQSAQISAMGAQIQALTQSGLASTGKEFRLP